METNWPSKECGCIGRLVAALGTRRIAALKIGLLALIVSFPLYGPATMRGRASSPSGGSLSSPGPSLNSQFLKVDSTAQAIAAGTTTYDISNTNYVFGQLTPADTTLFGYRVEMAIRQLGYALPYWRAAGASPARLLLNKFQRLNGLPVSDIVDQNVIMAMDNQLVTGEQIDAVRGPAFPLYSRMADPPMNEPSSL